MNEQELIEQGYKKETLTIHISEYDTNAPGGYNHRSLSYDLNRDFTDDQIAGIELFIREVNRRFPNIKMFATGTGWVKKVDNGESVQD